MSTSKQTRLSYGGETKEGAMKVAKPSKKSKKDKNPLGRVSDEIPDVTPNTSLADWEDAKSKIFNNRQIWRNLMKIGTLDENDDLRVYADFVDKTDKCFDSHYTDVTINDLLPVAIMWTFIKNPKKKREKISGITADEAREVMIELLAEAKAIGGKQISGDCYLDKVFPDEINVGMLMLTSGEHIVRYAERRGLLIEWEKDKYGMSEPPTNRSMNDQEIIKAVEFRYNVAKAINNHCVNQINIRYIAACSKWDAKFGLFARDEIFYIAKKVFGCSNTNSTNERWKQIKKTMAFGEILDVGKLGFSPGIISGWPSAYLGMLKSELSISPIPDTDAMIREVARETVSKNWYEWLPNTYNSRESMFNSMSLDQLIECFLASNTRDILQIHNGPSSFYQINLQSKHEQLKDLLIFLIHEGRSFEFETGGLITEFLEGRVKVAMKHHYSFAYKEPEDVFTQITQLSEEEELKSLGYKFILRTERTATRSKNNDFMHKNKVVEASATINVEVEDGDDKKIENGDQTI
jgi:hypothetical protein